MVTAKAACNRLLKQMKASLLNIVKKGSNCRLQYNVNLQHQRSRPNAINIAMNDAVES